MPELPEVDLMVTRLRAITAVRNKVVLVRVERQNGRYLPNHETSDLLLAEIKKVSRRAKIIVFETSAGILLCHNAMSGYWDTDEEPWTFDYVEGRRKSKTSDIRVVIALANDNDGSIVNLQFHDARLFGSLRFYPGVRDALDVLPDYGPDAIVTENSHESVRFTFLGAHLCDVSHRQLKPDRPIKDFLMDQKVVAGVGNIYAAESLFLAKIDPRRPISSISSEEFADLAGRVKNVLVDAIERNVRYDDLRVYRRKYCYRCGNKIVKEQVARRSTYFCVHCQK